MLLNIVYELGDGNVKGGLQDAVLAEKETAADGGDPKVRKKRISGGRRLAEQ